MQVARADKILDRTRGDKEEPHRSRCRVGIAQEGLERRVLATLVEGEGQGPLPPNRLRQGKNHNQISEDTSANSTQWVDEDEQDENPEDEDFMNKMGGMGGAGGAGGNGFEGIDFSKLGSGPGGDPADLPEEDSDDDEDEMPELEGEEEESAPASKKIEEVE